MEPILDDLEIDLNDLEKIEPYDFQVTRTLKEHNHQKYQFCQKNPANEHIYIH